MTDLLPSMPGIALPKRDIYVFIAYSFFIGAIGFAAGWLVAKYAW